MTLIVEDGTGLATAESYATVDQMVAYGDRMGMSLVDYAMQETALRRATMYIDRTYRSRFPGYRKNGRGQALEWPRLGAYVVPQPRRDGFAIQYGYGAYETLPSNAVPIEVINATIEAAFQGKGQPALPDTSVATQVTTTGDTVVIDDSVVGALKALHAGGSSKEWYQPSAATIAAAAAAKKAVVEAAAATRADFASIDAILAGILLPRSAFLARA